MMRYHIQHLAHVAVTGSDYNIYLSVCITTQTLHVFKYNEVCCEYEQFDNQDEACEFIRQPLARNPRKKY